MINLNNKMLLNTFDEIPEPKPDAKRITGVKRKNGKIVGYELGSDLIVDKDEAIQMAKDGMILNVGIAHRKDSLYLKTLPDGDDSDNLSNM